MTIDLGTGLFVDAGGATQSTISQAITIAAGDSIVVGVTWGTQTGASPATVTNTASAQSFTTPGNNGADFDAVLVIR